MAQADDFNQFLTKVKLDLHIESKKYNEAKMKEAEKKLSMPIKYLHEKGISADKLITTKEFYFEEAKRHQKIIDKLESTLKPTLVSTSCSTLKPTYLPIRMGTELYDGHDQLKHKLVFCPLLKTPMCKSDQTYIASKEEWVKHREKKIVKKENRIVEGYEYQKFSRFFGKEASTNDEFDEIVEIAKTTLDSSYNNFFLNLTGAPPPDKKIKIEKQNY